MKTTHTNTLFMWKMVLMTSLVCIAGSMTAADFSVSLRSEKQAYILGEPIDVTATIQYQGPNPIDVNNPLDPGPYKETLEVAAAKEPKLEKFKTRIEVMDEKKDRTLLPPLHFEPGTTIVREHTVVCWHKRSAPKDSKSILVFPKAGEYLIRFTVSLGEKTFHDELRISITEPVDDADKQAWTWLREGDRLEKFRELDSVPDDIPQDLAQKARKKMLNPFNELLKKHPASTYAKYVRKVAPKHEPE